MLYLCHCFCRWFHLRGRGHLCSSWRAFWLRSPCHRTEGGGLQATCKDWVVCALYPCNASSLQAHQNLSLQGSAHQTTGDCNHNLHRILAMPLLCKHGKACHLKKAFMTRQATAITMYAEPLQDRSSSSKTKLCRCKARIHETTGNCNYKSSKDALAFLSSACQALIL